MRPQVEHAIPVVSLKTFPRLVKAWPWVVWTLAATFFFYKYFLQVSPGVMVDELTQTFNLSGVALGSVAGIYFYAYLIMQVPTGLLLDRFGGRYLMTFAILLTAISALAFSQAQHVYTLLIARFCMGIAGAFATVGSIRLAALWFAPKHFAVVSGLLVTVAMLGAMSGGGVLAYMIAAWGWRGSMQIGCLFGLVMAVVFWALIRDIGLPDKTQLPKQSNIRMGMREIIRNKQVWLVSLYSGLAFAPVLAFASLWGVPYLQLFYHAPKEIVASLVSLVFLGFAIGAPLGGYVSDRLGRRKPVMLYSTIATLCLTLIILYVRLPSILLLGAALLLLGVMAGFYYVSFAYIREVNRPEVTGAAIGFVNMFNALFGGLIAPVAGKVLDISAAHFGRLVHNYSIIDYQYAMEVLPLALFMAILFILFSKENYCRQLSDQ